MKNMKNKSAMYNYIADIKKYSYVSKADIDQLTNSELIDWWEFDEDHQSSLIFVVVKLDGEEDVTNIFRFSKKEV